MPPDLHAHAPLPPPIPVVPDIPMAGGVPEPAETGCPHRLGGFTLLSPSWQDNIRANPLPAQQTATVVWAKGEYVPRGLHKQQRHVYRDAIHRYKRIWGLSARDDVPKWILDQIAAAIKEGANAVDAAEEADSPPEDDEA